MFSPGLIYGALGVIAFSLTLPLTRLAVVATSPMDVFVIRLVLSTVAAALVLLLARVSLPPRRYWGLLLGTSAGVVIGFPLLTSVAMQTAPAAHGGVVLAILPLATAIAAVFVNQERPRLLFWLFAVAGSALVVIFSLRDGGGTFSSADILLLLAIISAALGYAMGARLSQSMPAWRVISWALAITLPVALPSLLLLDVGRLTPAVIGEAFWPAVLSMLYLGAVSQYAGFLLWYRALALDGVGRAGQLQLLQPFLTLLAAALLLGEAITADAVGFAVLILGTVVASRLSAKPLVQSKPDPLR